VVALGTAGYGTASLLVAIEKAVRASGYALRVVNTLDGEPDDIAAAVDSLLEQGVDGIIVSEPIVEGEVSVRADVPVLFLGAPPAFGGSRAVTGPLRWYAARDRVEGWRTALAARGRHQPPLLEGDWSAASGYLAGRELAADPDVTAVFVSGDDMAIGNWGHRTSTPSRRTSATLRRARCSSPAS
jgi:DNA-binding LacI/PurR family transcriptional regulator